VRTLHASGSGDDEVVAAVIALAQEGREVTVVTADRPLRRRVEEAGADVVGPAWLLDRL
jgi:rRNA-processing protein FCF1